VHVKIREGDKERVQAFEGVVIKRDNGPQASFTVRKISFGQGVERIFPVHSKVIDKVDLLRSSKVRRAKLYYLRGLKGKAARLRDATLTSHIFRTNRNPVPGVRRSPALIRHPNSEISSNRPSTRDSPPISARSAHPSTANRGRLRRFFPSRLNEFSAVSLFGPDEMIGKYCSSICRSSSSHGIFPSTHSTVNWPRSEAWESPLQTAW